MCTKTNLCSVAIDILQYFPLIAAPFPIKQLWTEEVHLNQLPSCSPTPSPADPSSSLPLTLGDTRLLELCRICTCPNWHSKNKYYQERGL